MDHEASGESMVADGAARRGGDFADFADFADDDADTQVTHVFPEGSEATALPVAENPAEALVSAFVASPVAVAGLAYLAETDPAAFHTAVAKVASLTRTTHAAVEAAVLTAWRMATAAPAIAPIGTPAVEIAGPLLDGGDATAVTNDRAVAPDARRPDEPPVPAVRRPAESPVSLAPRMARGSRSPALRAASLGPRRLTMPPILSASASASVVAARAVELSPPVAAPVVAARAVEPSPPASAPLVAARAVEPSPPAVAGATTALFTEAEVDAMFADLAPGA